MCNRILQETYTVNLEKPEGSSLGFSVLGKRVAGTLCVCVKGVNKGGLAEQEGSISIGDRIIKVR